MRIQCLNFINDRTLLLAMLKIVLLCSLATEQLKISGKLCLFACLLNSLSI